MTTSTVILEMRRADSVARTRALLWRKQHHGFTPVRHRIVGRTIRGGNAWESFRQAGSLFSLYNKQ
jgi:hypothetical protein